MIPNIFHFVYFTPADLSAKFFSLAHYLAIQSAIVKNTPEKVIFYFDKEPYGEWWNKIKPLLTLHQMEAPKTFLGRDIFHLAHKADVVRLQALKETGGIYLDLDTISVKPLTNFLNNSFLIGRELDAEYVPKNWRQKIKYTTRKKFGLLKSNAIVSANFCNAVLLSEKNSAFVNLWLNEYKTFRSLGRDKYWNEHSSIIPERLAKQHPELITIESPYAFHYPLYDKKGLQSMFETVTDFPNAYLHHIWESFSWNDYLSKLSVEQIRQKDTTYNLIARKVLDPKNIKL